MLEFGQKITEHKLEELTVDLEVSQMQYSEIDDVYKIFQPELKSLVIKLNDKEDILKHMQSNYDDLSTEYEKVESELDKLGHQLSKCQEENERLISKLGKIKLFIFRRHQAK